MNYIPLIILFVYYYSGHLSDLYFKNIHIVYDKMLLVPMKDRRMPNTIPGLFLYSRDLCYYGSPDPLDAEEVERKYIRFKI